MQEKYLLQSLYEVNRGIILKINQRSSEAEPICAHVRSWKLRVKPPSERNLFQQ